MIADVASFAYRYLRNLARFRACNMPLIRAAELPYSCDKLDLDYGETLLGIYENTVDSLDGAIIVTDRRICILTSSPIAIYYSRVAQTKYAKFTPEMDDQLVVVDSDNGLTIRFAVVGSHTTEYGKSFDSYAVGNFLSMAAAYSVPRTVG